MLSYAYSLLLTLGLRLTLLRSKALCRGSKLGSIFNNVQLILALPFYFFNKEVSDILKKSFSYKVYKMLGDFSKPMDNLVRERKNVKGQKQKWIIYSKKVSTLWNWSMPLGPADTRQSRNCFNYWRDYKRQRQGPLKGGKELQQTLWKNGYPNSIALI